MTVAELISELQKFPPETPVSIDDDSLLRPPEPALAPAGSYEYLGADAPTFPRVIL